MASPIRIDELAGSNWDAYTGSSDPAEQAFIVSHVNRISSFSPYFDAKLSWYPNARFYTDSYALFNPADNALIASNPTWVLRDGGGAQLYIGFGCSGGSCPQWAGNIADAGFRAYQISLLSSRASAGYIGIFLDDVNLTLDNVTDGSGSPVTPINTGTGLPMTLSEWQAYWVTYLNEIRAAFPSLNIVHNSLWYLPSTADTDSQVQAANLINVERGFGDSGLTGGTGTFSVYALWNYIDHVHSLGSNVIIENYNPARTATTAEVHSWTAGYLMAWSAGDGLAFADLVPDPATWPTTFFALNLGTPTGSRSNVTGGLWRRDYSGGVTLFNEPGASPVTYSLGGTFFDELGTPFNSVTLAAGEGAVLASAAVTPYVETIGTPVGTSAAPTLPPSTGGNIDVTISYTGTAGNTLMVGVASFAPSAGMSTDASTGTVTDTLGNAYRKLELAGAAVQQPGSGIFISQGILGGANTIKFQISAFNGNPIFTLAFPLAIAVCEISQVSSAAVQSHGTRQIPAGTSDIAVTITDSRNNSVTTDGGPQSQSSLSVADLRVITGVDFFMAVAAVGSNPAGAWPLTVSGQGYPPWTYTSQVEDPGSPSNILYLWTRTTPIPIVAPPPVPPGLEDWLVVNEPPTGSPATGGGLTKRGSFLHLGDQAQHSFNLQTRQRGNATYTLVSDPNDPRSAPVDYLPTLFQPIYLFDHNTAGWTLMFSGLIQDYTVRWVGIGGLRYIDCSAVTLEAVFDTVYCDGTDQFVNQTTDAILTALFNKYETGCPVGLGTVSAGVTIPLFNPEKGQKLSQIFDQLALTSEFIWGVDPQTATLYFCAPTTTAAPFTLNSSQALWDSISEKVDGADYRNRQGVKIAEEAFPQSGEWFAGAGQTFITLLRPVKQVVSAYITLGTPNFATGTFSGQPAAGDTITIGPQNIPFGTGTYLIGQIIVQDGFVQQITTPGTFTSTPTFSHITGGTSVGGGTGIFTCLGPYGVGAGVEATTTYTFVNSLDNTQYGQVLIGATLAETVQNLVDAINSTAPYGGPPPTSGRGFTFSLPTWEGAQVNAYLLSGTQLKVITKQDAIVAASALTKTGTAFSWSNAQTTGGNFPQGSLGPNEPGTISIQVYQVGTNTAAPAVAYTPGSAVIQMATPLDAGSNLNVWYTRADGGSIEVENTPLVNSLAATTHGTGKIQQFTDQSQEGLIATSARAGLQLAQQALAAFDVPPTELDVVLYQPGILPGQIWTWDLTFNSALNGDWFVAEVKAEIVPVWPWMDRPQVPLAGHYRYTIRVVDVSQVTSYMDFWEGLGGGGGGGGLGAGALVPTSGGALNPGSGGTGNYPLGVSFRTASATLAAVDANTLVVVQDASPHTAVTLTLPATPPSALWQVELKNDSSFSVTIDPNGLLLDGLSSSITLGIGAGLEVRTDGTNYFTQPGSGSGSASPLTTKGDIYTHNATVDARLAVGTNGQVLTANSSAATGNDWEAPIALTTTGTSGPATVTPGNPYTLNVPQYAASPSGSYNVAIELLGQPAGSSATLALFVFTETVNFAANFGGSVGTVGTNPTGSQTYTVKKNGSTIGTVTISTGGVVGFTTSGGATESFASGDELTLIGTSGSADATLADVSITLQGTRASVTSTPIAVIPASWIGLIPGSQIIGIFTFSNPITFLANFSGAAGKCGTNPTATATFNVKKNGSTVGTVAISTGGAFTFATSGGVAVTFNTGDEITVVAPSSPDATLADVAMSFSGSAGGFITATGTLTNDLPVFGAGSSGVKVGTKTGNTDEVVTATGSATSGYPLLYDASGNAVADQPRGNTTVVQLADSTTNPTSGDLAAFDASGNVKDAGFGSPIPVNKGGTGQTSYTDGQLLIGNSSGNTLTKATLTAGTNVTITNAGGSITIAASGGGGGGGALVLLGTYNASSSAELDITTRNASGQSGAIIQSDYDEYVIEVNQMVPATNLVNIGMQFSTNGGSTWDTGSNYAWVGCRQSVAGAANSTGSNGTTSFGLDVNGQVSSTASRGGLIVTLRLYLYQNGTQRPKLKWEASNDDGTGNIAIWCTAAGTYLSTTAINALRVLASSGNLTSGSVRVYGLSH